MLQSRKERNEYLFEYYLQSGEANVNEQLLNITQVEVDRISNKLFSESLRSKRRTEEENEIDLSSVMPPPPPALSGSAMIGFQRRHQLTAANGIAFDFNGRAVIDRTTIVTAVISIGIIISYRCIADYSWHVLEAGCWFSVGHGYAESSVSTASDCSQRQCETTEITHHGQDVGTCIIVAWQLRLAGCFVPVCDRR